MIQKFSNLKLFQKLGVLIFIMSIPVFVLGAAYLRVRSQTLSALTKEKETLAYLDAAHALLRDIAVHRGLNNRILTGDSGARAQQTALRPQIESTFDAIQRLDDGNANKFGQREEAATLRRNWADVSQKAWTLTGPQSLDIHTRLNDQVIQYISKLGDQALILEPDLDAYHVCEPLVVGIPNLIEAIGLLRGQGVGFLNLKAATADNRADVSNRIGRGRYLLAKVRDSITVSLRTNQTFSSRLGAELVRATGAAEAYFARADEQIARASTISDDPKEYFAEGTAAIEAFNKFTQTAMAAINENVDARITAAKWDIYIQGAIVTFGLLLALLAGRMLANFITRQVQALTDLISNIGMGDFAARAKVYGQDELGSVTVSLNGMLDTVLNLIQSQDEKEKLESSLQELETDISAVADGDLTAEAKITSDVTAKLASSVNSMVSQLRDIISRVHDTTLSVSSSAGEVQTTTEHLANGSEHQALQISEASAAIDEVAVSIQQVSANAATAATVADRAQQIAKTGAQSVSRTIDGMTGIRDQVQQTAKRIKRLGESSQEVGEIVQLISGIADRTSILALNASVQAAAAGEAGKAFAVVAEEVEALAERSAEATKKIASLIKGIQSETSHAIAAMEETTKEVVNGSSVANEAGQKLVEIEQVSTQLAELIQSIAMAAKQQTRGSESVAKTMGDISGITQQTAAGAKQAAVSIRKLSELANDLRSSMDRFRLPAAA